MEYQLNLGVWNSVFAVPCALVDRHLKLAGKEQLQVILWLLRHSAEPVSPQLLAAALSMSEDSAADALEYWVQEGLLAAEDGSLSPLPQTPAIQPKAEAAAAAAPAPAPAPQTPDVPSPIPPKRMLRGDGVHLAARMQESSSIRYLMQEAEATLGKTLSPSLSSTLLSLCDDYGLPVEVLITILHYAKDIGKTGTAYIESLAKGWSAEGIVTLEAAEQKLRDLTERRLAWNKVASIVGLSRRSPSKKEEEAAWLWMQEWKIPEEMIVGAYERCANNTGKFSCPYMGKILDQWHREGFCTLAEVEAAEAGKKSESSTDKSYDIEEYERTSFFDLPEEL